jgi:hypothetical protein
VLVAVTPLEMRANLFGEEPDATEPDDHLR